MKPEVWHYCKSEDNPTDVITRESSPLKLSDNKLWWNGPNYLYSPEENWDKSCEELCGESQKLFESEIKGNRGKNVRTFFIKEEHPINLQEVLQLDSFSNVKKLYRVTSWVLRFINNLKRKVHNEVLNLSRCLDRTEINASRITLAA